MCTPTDISKAFASFPAVDIDVFHVTCRKHPPRLHGRGVTSGQAEGIGEEHAN